MKFTFARPAFAMALAALALALPEATTAAAEPSEARPMLALDCWIATDRRSVVTEYIRCIRDRGAIEASPNANASQAELVLDRMHRLIHDGSIEVLDLFAIDKMPMLGPDDVATIRIFSYPSPWSWDEQRPQQLVRATLCPVGYTCPVHFRQDFPAQTPLAGFGRRHRDALRQVSVESTR